LDDARKKGQISKSKDLTGVVVFLVGLSALKVSWDGIEKRFRDLFSFTFDHISDTPEAMHTATRHAMQLALTDVILMTIPIAGACAMAGLMMDFLQVKALFTLDPLMPKLEKLNPIEGLKNMFKMKQLVELIKSMVKILVTGYVVFGVVRDSLGMVVGTVHGDASTTILVLGELVYRVAVKVALLYFLFAIFDVWFQGYSFNKDMKMTKDEVKREYKESEGDPHHKAKRKELHQEILESAAMENVKGADVVVTNPEHVAVALKYDKERDGAPRVIARGFDARAQAIKQLAREGDVAILRNVPLAHALVKVDIGDEIPEELYDAVAEVLNFVYGLKNPTATGASAPAERPAARV
jgi:flagellar biosynthesis protein FlhB